ELEARYNHLQKQLASQVPEIQLTGKLPDRFAVAEALPTNSILVEFVRFDVYDFHAVPARKQTQWHPARYLAFILPAQQPDAVQMIDLGAAEIIDELIREFRWQVSDYTRTTLAWGKAASIPKLQIKQTVKQLRQSALGLEVLKELLRVNELSPQSKIDCHEEDTPLEHPFYWGAWICQGKTDKLKV
ncbi:hypothetical protein CEN46_02210, partial [Fischerella thermalis CCMEE 5318]